MPTIEGRALGFGLTLATEQIFDPATPELPSSEASLRLFAAIDPGLAARLASGDVVVVEEVADPHGAASRALSLLAQAGVVAFVAKRFALTTIEAAAAAGIVTLAVDTPSMLRTGDRLRLDLDAAKIVDLSSGDRVAIRNASTITERATLRATLARMLR
ncbi:MAG: hypothetical protein IT379_24015 [Deltaproteobacteria bacterium]|nr:hypothetical protein [Deltaproteobacteria bacterium]